MLFRWIVFAGLCAAGLVPVSARADFILPAVSNATVQPGGPRTGANGLRFFNVETGTAGAFANFGVIDFAPAAVNPAVVVQSVSLKLTQSNAAFTANGALDFYVATDTTTAIGAGTSPLRFDPLATPGGIGAQLSPRFLLGSGTFTQVADGTADTFSFALTNDERDYLTGRIAMGGPIRLIVAPADATVAATYAGVTNTQFSGPVLTLLTDVLPTPVPEPANGALALAGLAGLALARTRPGVRRAT